MADFIAYLDQSNRTNPSGLVLPLPQRTSVRSIGVVPLFGPQILYLDGQALFNGQGVVVGFGNPELFSYNYCDFGDMLDHIDSSLRSAFGPGTIVRVVQQNPTTDEQCCCI